MNSRTLSVELDEEELAQIRDEAAAEGVSLQKYANDTLMSAVSARVRRGHRRDEELDRVAAISAALNRRLAE
ncbi:MAG TPA: hypothetical protein VG253_08385 [Streptosporangiaceae bacterium]|nr:hypothetical protein [Streptosporangiaceae bacterium]